MARASRMVRKLRRARREATLAHRMIDVALNQRDYARALVNALGKELEKRDAPPDLTITKIEEPEPTVEPTGEPIVEG